MNRRESGVDGAVFMGETAVGMMGTKAGTAAVLYGLYWLISYFGPKIIAGGLGPLTFIVVPLAIIISALLLLGTCYFAISFEDPITLSVYSIAISFFSVTFFGYMGWLGQGNAGKYIAYFLVFIVSWPVLMVLMERERILKAAKILGGIAIFGALLIPFLQTAADIISAAGWL